MSPATARRHAPALSVAAGAVLLLHAWLLQSTLGLGSRPTQPTPAAPAVVLQTRSVTTAPTSLAMTDQASRRPPATPAGHSSSAARPEKAPEPSAAAPMAATTPAAALDVASVSGAAQANPADAESRAELEAGTETDPLAQNTPVYSAAPAPAATLVYEWQRGRLQGQARLQWVPHATPQTNAYRLQLQFDAPGPPPSIWSSVGRLDATGLAPERYSEWRRHREVRATNFQRDSQTLTFSAQDAVLPLPGGIQDRSSWMLQLGAVLQANPGLAEIGGQVILPVVGTRGRPEAWTFTVLQRAPLETPGGTVVDALQLQREPRRPYDTRVTVWLDPARHHLPLDVQLVVHGVGEVQRWRLLGLQWE